MVFADKFSARFQGLALSLLMALVLGTDNHNLAVSLDYLAFIAHRLYRRSNFHDNFLSSISFFLGRKNKFADLRALPSPHDRFSPRLSEIVRLHLLRCKYAQIGAACQKAWFLAATLFVLKFFFVLFFALLLQSPHFRASI